MSPGGSDLWNTAPSLSLEGAGSGRALTLVERAYTGGVSGGLAPVLHMQLAQDVLDVGLDGVLRDDQLVSDGRIGHAPRDEL